MFDTQGWTYFNYPKPMALTDYSSEIERYIRSASKNDDVVAIYSMGTTKCPGISDIDLIVVTKDIIRNAQNLSVQRGGYDNNLFLHDVIVVSERIFPYLQYIFIRPLCFVGVGGRLTMYQKEIDQDSEEHHCTA